jgi:hypothetical protein
LQDNNLGLAKQVIASLYKRNIQRLTQTYLTLSLQDIADTVQLDGQKDAELHILQMVSLIYFPTVFFETVQVRTPLKLLLKQFLEDSSCERITWTFDV